MYYYNHCVYNNNNVIRSPMSIVHFYTYIKLDIKTYLKKAIGALINAIAAVNRNIATGDTIAQQRV